MGFIIKNGVLVKYTSEKGVTDVVIPDSVTEIGDRAFKGCSSLTSVTIPEGVKCIKAGAFRDCSHIESISLPDSLDRLISYSWGGVLMAAKI